MSKKNIKKSKDLPVELGFIDEESVSNSWELSSVYFPSKLGGKPSWLNLSSIPGPKLCSNCESPLKFLLQLYAPIGTCPSYHRSLFVFICSKTPNCLETNSPKNILVYRSRVDYVNEWYGPSEEEKVEEIAVNKEINWENRISKLCRVCGWRGDNKCGGCGKINYCSKEHQEVDWKERHKTECKDENFVRERSYERSSGCYPEMEIYIEREFIPKTNEKEASDADKLKEYEKMVAEGKINNLDGVGGKELLEATSYKSDKTFNKFRKRISHNPHQVVRYSRNSSPLWLSSLNIPSNNEVNNESISNCGNCGSERVFECQLMPQLLNYLGEESLSGHLDFGTLVVYTCGNDCQNDKYLEEVIWRQDFAPDEQLDK